MPPPATLERKQVALDDLALLDTASTGSFGGYASSFGNVDAYGDTIVPGAYAATIPKFLVHGFIGWGHDDRIPVAYLTDAREDEYGLWIEAVFHGTPAAQEARQITAERIAAGKRMGLSIGYWPVKSEEGPNDTRRLLEIDLVETSLVLVPADEAARVAAVKDAAAASDQAGRSREPLTVKVRLSREAERLGTPVPSGFASWLEFFSVSEPITDAEVQAIWEGR